MPTPRISITADALSQDLRTAARLSRQAGFGGLLFDTAASGQLLMDLSATGCREVRHILASHEQTLVGLDIRLPDKGLRPDADIERAVHQLDRAMQAARNLSAEVVCVDLGPLPPTPHAPRPKPKITPEQAGLIIIPTTPAEEPEPAPPPAKPDPAFTASLTDALREIGSRADRYSVMLAFRSSLSGFAALTAALRTVDCPWFGVDFDPAAAVADVWDIDQILSELGPVLRHVRARDAIRGDGRIRPAAVGQGDTDWPALLAALDDAAYHGWLTVDPIDLPDRRAAALAAKDYLANVR